MTAAELAAAHLSTSLPQLLRTLADFSEADMLVRPVPGANHAAWQLGHLILSEHNMLKGIAPDVEATLPVPAAWAEPCSKAGHSIDEPGRFPPKQEMLDHLAALRQLLADRVAKMSPEELSRETGFAMAPTVGQMAILAAGHGTMHVGQFQVIRRKLGKPVLF